MGYACMTEVQHQSLPEVLQGHDVLVKARTGTGKTLAFLVPAIEVLIKERNRAAPEPRVLILSPTRELAQQIAAEARTLCTHHKIGVLLLVGGTNMASDQRALLRTGAGQNDIIVATPGRMLGHLQETAGFADACRGVKVFVMDEADRLLDMGFKNDMDKIVKYMDKRDTVTYGQRQTLLFSATVAPEIRQIAKTSLLPGYKMIDTVGEEVEQTHSHVPQYVTTVPLKQQVEALVQLIEQHVVEQGDKGFKIILFFATARQTGYCAEVLNALGLNVLEIHSRKSQGHRTRVSEEFRTGKNMIMASSDVSARGMDYPDVSFVLQVGTTTRDQYIHRLGRTARAGKSGAGLLMLAPFENKFMTRDELKDLPLQTKTNLLSAEPTPLTDRVGKAVAKIIKQGQDSDKDTAEMAWAAWLGHYSSMCKKLDMTREQMVETSAEYAASLGFAQIPELQKSTISKMGLKVSIRWFPLFVSSLSLFIC
ncbi:P-loop containing nucleoside triphosphate hydrolase protein [Ochromonadaceae sp. CCMP2298]|nr:P-loop containing nucleoside triphosphate hydrolase protein [Ochromonadaceae sp. CCMP2298]